MKEKVSVIYRDEFVTEVEVEGKDEKELVENAIKEFKKSKKIEVLGSFLNSEFFNVLDHSGHDLTK